VSLGIIARCDNRGIAYQTWEAVNALKPDRVLLVLLNDKHWPEDPGRFGRSNVHYVDTTLGDRVLDETKVRKFLDGLTSVFAVETLYDWDLADWAREAGCRTVVQANPEFYNHHRHPERAEPDEWVWPTEWMRDHEDLPLGSLLPVPAPMVDTASMPSLETETLRVLHVAGHRALGDRNGTDLFFESLALIGSRVHVTVIGQDGQLPTGRLGRNVTIETNPKGVQDRWDLYRNQHVVVLPRRYGGLSLPAIEACASGVVPMMPGVPENGLWPIVQLPARSGRLQRVPFGMVPTWAVRPNAIAHELDKLNRHRDRLAEARQRVLDWAEDNSWESWEPAYRGFLP
jgi:hypothetical protein